MCFAGIIILFYWANDGNQTRDLIYTKDALYQLSYIGLIYQSSDTQTRTVTKTLWKFCDTLSPYRHTNYLFFTIALRMGFEQPKIISLEITALL